MIRPGIPPGCASADRWPHADHKERRMPPTWSNWSESVACQPAAIRYPQSLEEMVAIVNECRRAGRGLRVVGSGHSFTPLVATDGVLISLDRYSGLEQIDVAGRTATVRGGTK